MGKEHVITYKYIADLFAVDRKEAVRIYKKLEQVVYKSNDVIIRAGDEADGLYFLEEGQVTVFDADGEQVNEMGAGQYFGEYAILSDEKRMTTVKAHGRVVAYKMSNTDFLSVVAKHPKITGRMLKQVYGQITDKHTRLVSLTRKSRGIMWAPTDNRDLDLKSLLITYGPTVLVMIAAFIAAPHIEGTPIWWQLLPVVFLMAFTIRTRRVVEGLLLTVVLLAGMLGGGHFIVGFKDMMIEGIGNTDTAETAVIMAMVECVAALLASAGVVTAFKKLAEKYVKSRRGSHLGMLFMMILVCMDECLNVITAGFCFNDVADKNRVPRESSAILGSFSTAICSLIPFSLWSAYISGWIGMYIDDGGSIFLKSLAFNLVGIFALIFAVMLCFGILPKTGQIKEAFKRVENGGSLWPEGSEDYFEFDDDGVVGKPRNLILPMLVWMVSSVVCGMVGDSESFALDAISGLFITLLFMFVLYVAEQIMTPRDYFEIIEEGVGNSLMPILLLVFSERISECLADLGFGDLLEQVILKVVGDNLFLIPALLFVLFLVVTIGLGTCWGTLGLAIPITVFLAVNLGISVPLCMGATLSASIVGETLCPYIDDSLPVITSIGCEPDAYRKIRVQYWTPMAVLCLVGYLILGLIFI